MPQVYATVYDGTSVLVFTKNAHSNFFQGKGSGGAIVHGPKKCCFPGGGLSPQDQAGRSPKEARIAGARREFLEETGFTLPAEPTVSFTNPQNASCHFFLLPAGVTLEQVRTEIAAQLALANSDDWQQAITNDTLHIRDNELASVAVVPWSDLPGGFFPVDDDDVDWFRGFVAEMKQFIP
ncbi:NUDIX hydrolase [uncultured Rikenella sp.]|uniref:NUDIX domain-containing protein n=1 Tax=uncultured Rikenella sp. TaxID=368003 RepID=UPI00262A1D1A|nr:NUDIX hydrolase [uncultured Rikenella sp.]